MLNSCWIQQIQVLLSWTFLVIFFPLNIFDLQLVETVDVASVDMEGQLYFKLCNLKMETILCFFESHFVLTKVCHVIDAQTRRFQDAEILCNILFLQNKKSRNYNKI